MRGRESDEMPILRATTESDEAYDDPSEDLLFMLMENIAAGEYLWVVVSAPQAEAHYAQAIRLESGLFQVERRRGTPETHETRSDLDMRQAHRLLTTWAYDLV